jgi:hypothetical protein
MTERSDESRARDRERSRKKRAEFKAQGLNSKGEPFKGQQKPTEAQADFVIFGKPSYERADREPTIPKKGETTEQRRARGLSLRGLPFASDIERSVRKRIERQEREERRR